MLKSVRARVDPERVEERPPIERAFFREADDGAPVFFPWGLSRRGYRLPDAAAKHRAARAVSLLIGSTLAIATWIAYALQPQLEPGAGGAQEFAASLLVPGAVLLLVFCAYLVWAARFVEDLPESALQVSREERLREAAELAGPGKVALLGIALCGLCALLLWLRPQLWWLALAGIALGIATLAWGLALHRARERPIA